MANVHPNFSGGCGSPGLHHHLVLVQVDNFLISIQFCIMNSVIGYSTKSNCFENIIDLLYTCIGNSFIGV